MAGARALWVANGMKREQFGKPIIAVVNSFTQFVFQTLIIGGSVLLISAGVSAFNCFFRWSAIVAFLYTY